MEHPLFCLNVSCKLHKQEVNSNDWYRKEGYYSTKAFGKVQRFKCKKCGKGFSTQSFSLDYYAKRVISYEELLKKIVSTSSTRDISRDFKISTETVQNKVMRLAHQAIALQEEMKTHISLGENIVADGFESYCVSQYFPNNIHLLAGKDSQFLYYTNYVTIRRKGRMTDKQKARREELEKLYWAPYKGIECSFIELLDDILSIHERSSLNPLVLYTDKKYDYVKALNFNKDIALLVKQNKIKHIRIHSKRARTVSNPLFAVNYLDRQIRKDMANHVRETVCFSRNVSNCMERLMVYFMYHNYLKIYREKQKRKDKRTHAEVAGLDKKVLKRGIKSIFTKRRFLTLENIKGFILHLWKRQLFTPLKCRIDYIPRYVLA